ncbi:SUMF1/EgtB/PvdO family nonheme iron enzyme [Actinoplanes bogorensis]|uniref:SUMF1/EgtB/PvdO family nonheme iron enzyme n=1 Tax=Paractinoplanes bogorensis TaxID=1610840 RepID=A0ABS5YS39_9ACTN|nr:SUMF1/EgtB/PvdO family nonheme iron enzyme [Actinoplanes bogorensis]MBU2666265.1 SUMF1/EgtB/PvdO family nonheme iron enzyme [Actinoplanes bogorensis]
MSSSEAGSRAPLSHARPTLFLLHSSTDREWVDGFLRPGLGLPDDDIVTGESFRPGVAMVDEVARAVRETEFTLLVLSDAFLTDHWATFGGTLAAHADVTGPGRVVPLMLHPCELPLNISYRVLLDCTDPDRWGIEIERLRHLLNVPEPPAERVACPYPGMVAFGSADARFFYGRDRETDDLVHRLRHQRFLLIVGPSGSGKSSLVTAGLLPRLTADGGWFIRTVRPGERPYEALQLALDGNSGRMLLVIDPLEEVFVQASPGERERFLRALAVLRDSGACAIVLLMRANSYAELMNSPLWPVAPGERVEIVPLREAELRQAIARPARDVGVHLEPVLIERLMHDAVGEPGVLPLLQAAMVLLWERRSRRLLTAQAYAALGTDDRSGLTTAMAIRADAALAELSPARQDIVRRILLRLVHLSDDHGDSRRRQPVSALRTGSDNDADFEATLRHLADRRLVIVSGDEHESRTADLAHEQLIRGWPTLRDWVAQNRADELTRRRISHDAGDWAGGARELYRGRRLSAAVDWSRRYPYELGTRESRFLRAGRRWRAVRRISLAALTLAFLAGTVWLAVPQVQQWRWRNEASRLGPTVLLPAGVAQIGPGPSPTTLPALRFDVHEVTNRQFRLCVRARHCLESIWPIDPTMPAGDADDQPVAFVTAYQAAGYCAWVGRRLPTEDEWERGARGTTGRTYPWGDTPPDSAHVAAAFGEDDPPDAVPVGDHRYAAGDTPEGITHLAGNVQEWVSTLVRPDAKLDPVRSGRWQRIGPWNGRDRVAVLAVKGGGRLDEPVPMSLVNGNSPTLSDADTGFRCVSSDR